jgi:aspartyl-tRNA(Asn)/glutamyl-tRNA(Gln) amidotransferase subunit A
MTAQSTQSALDASARAAAPADSPACLSKDPLATEAPSAAPAKQKAWFLALCQAESVAFGDAEGEAAAFAEFQARLQGFEPLAAAPAAPELADLPATEAFEALAVAAAQGEGFAAQQPRPARPARALPRAFALPRPAAAGLQVERGSGFSWDAPEPAAARFAKEALAARAKAWAARHGRAPTEADLHAEHLARLREPAADEALANEALVYGAEWVAERVAAGDIGREELAEQFRRRARRLDPFVQAREFELAAQGGEGAQGPASLPSRASLAGVPVAVKSLFWIEGQVSSAGSKMLSRFRAPEDAGVVAALRAAGADLACVVKTDEFAMGSRGASCAWGATRHPFVLGASPGGSSSGSAAAVASGMALLGIGSDTGGSVRLPASHCGLWGLKPTRGELSRHGMVAYAFSLDTPGLLARGAGDLALGFEAMSFGAQFGPDPACKAWDRSGLRARSAAFAKGRLQRAKPLAGLRVGVPSYCLDGLRRPGGDRRDGLDAGLDFAGDEVRLELDPQIRARQAELLDSLELAGAEVGVARLPDPSLALLSYYLLASAEALSSLARMDALRLGFEAQGSGSWEEAFASGRTALIGREARMRILAGAHALAQGSRESLYARALGLRREAAEGHAGAFAQFDLILSPTAPFAAPPLDGGLDARAEWAADALTIPASLAGACALSAPWGAFADGSPMGFQLTAAWHGEERLLSWARLMDAVLPWGEGR